MLALLLCPLLLGGCGQRTVTINKDTLEGSRVAVGMFTPEFMIYDQLGQGADWVIMDVPGEMAMSLKSGRLDAMIANAPEANELCRNLGTDQFKAVPLDKELSAEISYPFYAGEGTLIPEFTAWLEEFKKTDEYADILLRANSTLDEPFVSKPVENVVTTDRVVRLGVTSRIMPYDYIDTETGKPAGAMVELMTHFANSIGAKIEIVSTQPSDMMAKVSSGMLDIAAVPRATGDQGRPGSKSEVVSLGSWPFHICLVTLKDTVVE